MFDETNAYVAPREADRGDGDTRPRRYRVIGCVVLSGFCALAAFVGFSFGFVGGVIIVQNEIGAQRAEPIRRFIHSDLDSFSRVYLDDSTGGYVYIMGQVASAEAEANEKNEKGMSPI